MQIVVSERKIGNLGEKSILEVTISLLIMISNVQPDIDGITAKWKHLACCRKCIPELKRVYKTSCKM